MEEIRKKIERKTGEIKTKMAEALEPLPVKARKVLEKNAEEALELYKEWAIQGSMRGKATLSNKIIRKNNSIGIIEPASAIKETIKRNKDEICVKACAYYYRAMAFYDLKKLDNALDDIDLAINCFVKKDNLNSFDKIVKVAKHFVNIDNHDYVLFFYYIRAKLFYEAGDLGSAKESIEFALQYEQQLTATKLGWNRELESIPYTSLNIQSHDYVPDEGDINKGKHFFVYETAKFKNNIRAKFIYMQGKLLHSLNEYTKAINTFKQISDMQDIYAADKENAENAVQVILNTNNEVIVEDFMNILQYPESLNIALINQMFARVVSLFDFKFPYTLASILLRENNVHRKEISFIIYQVLEDLARNHIYTDDCVAAFRHVLKSVHSKSLITESEKFKLKSIATKSSVFSDPRFKLMQQHIAVLEKNIKVIGNELQTLKDSLYKKGNREKLFSLVSIGLMFVGGALIGKVLVEITDLSDTKKLGSILLRLTEGKMGVLFEKGIEHIIKNKEVIMDTATTQMLMLAGFNPGLVFDTWVEATFTLQALDKQLPMISSNPSPFFPTKSNFAIGDEFRSYLQNRYREGYKFTVRRESNNKVTIECIAAKLADPMLNAHLDYIQTLFLTELEKVSNKKSEISHDRQGYTLSIAASKSVLDSIEAILEAVNGNESSTVLHSVSLDGNSVECKVM